jgi:hypothetical protein
MVYQTGKDVEIIITTEDTTYGLTTGSAQSTTASMDILSLNVAASASTLSANAGPVKNVTGLTYDFGRMRNELSVFGQDTRLNYPVKYNWNVTVTKPKTNDAWKKAYENASCGLSGSSPAVFHGMDNPTTNSGFRINIQDLAAGDNLPWVAGYGGVITAYTTDTNPEDVVFESITFTGFNWAPFATASFAARTTVY